jgi:hypothetical protein
MNVKELKELLDEYPSNLEVALYKCEVGYIELTEYDFEYMEISEPDSHECLFIEC